MQTLLRKTKSQREEWKRTIVHDLKNDILSELKHITLHIIGLK